MKMRVVSVLNHKGGVGKSTISTNLAGYFANQSEKVLLGDFDVQQSSRNWLNLRPENAAPISTWDMQGGQLMVPPEGTSCIIVDSPAGITGKSLKNLVSFSDKIIVPLKPSVFDMMSTKSFLEEIIEMINNQEKETDLCVVGSMVSSGTKSAEQLEKFVNSLGLDSPTVIRQAQSYVHLAAHGLTLFDAKNNAFEQDIQHWYPLIKWVLQ